MERKSILVNAKDAPSSNYYECSVCKQRFWLTAKYMKHMSIHRQLLLSCNICNKRFYNQKHLDEHYLSHTDVISTYDCDKCSRKFLQKYQLEHHMQFHLTPGNQFVEKEKKRVQFREILISKHISDDEISSESESDNDSNEENNGSITTTRYGRVVKAKKIFENEEPDVKSRYAKKVEEICMKETNTAVNTSLSTAPAANNIVKQHSEAILNKEICVRVKRLPDNLYNDYIKEGCGVTVASSKIYNLDKFKHSGDSFLRKYGDLRIESEVPKSATNASEEKQLIQLNTDIQKSNWNKNSKIVDDVTNGTPLNNINKSFCQKLDNPNTISKVINNKSKLNVSNGLPIKIVDVRSTVPPNTTSTCYENKLNKKKLAVQNKVSQIAVVSSKPNLTSESKTVPKSNTAKFKNAEQHPTVIKTMSSLPVKPQVEKQFLYVGPPQNFDKVKTVIDEMKSPGDKNAKLMDDDATSTLLSALKRSMPCNAQRFVPSKCFKEESSNGIIDKKIVNNFLVVKVTPDLMKQMHKNLESKVKQSNISSKTTVTNISNSCVSNSTITKSIRTQQSGNSVDRSAKMLGPMKTNSDSIKEMCIAQLNESDTSENSSNSVTGNISNLNAANKITNTCVVANKNYSNDKKINGLKNSVNVQAERYVVQPNKMATSESSNNCIVTSINSNISSLNATSTNLKDCVVETNESCVNDKIINDTKVKTVKKSISTVPQKMDKKCIVKPLECSLKNKNLSHKVPASIEVTVVSKSVLAEPFNQSVSQMRNNFSSLNENEQITPHSSSDLSKIKITQNLIERFRAKIAEKEHKKEEKYKQKKKLRYLESQISKKYPTLSVSAVQCSKRQKNNLNSMPIVNASGNKASVTVENGSIKQSTVKNSASSCNLSQNLTSNSQIKGSNTILQIDEKSAIKRVEEMCRKFEKNLNENECLNYLKQIDTLITKFNIRKKCPFIFRTLRFCRLHVNNYNVKEYAGALHTKIIEAM